MPYWMKFYNRTQNQTNGDIGDGTGGGGGKIDDSGNKGDPDPAEKALPEKSEGQKPSVSDAEAKLIKEVMDKKEKLRKATEEVEAVKAQLARFDGIDPDAIRAMLDQQKEAETKRLEAAGEWDRLKKQMADENAKKLDAASQEIANANNMVKQLTGQIAELTIGASFNSSPFVKDELLIPPSKVRALFGAHFETKDGAVVAYDKPAGNPERTVLVDSSGEPLGFEDALKRIIDADPDGKALMRAKIKQGAASGSKPKTGAPADIDGRKTGLGAISTGLSKGAFTNRK